MFMDKDEEISPNKEKGEESTFVIPTPDTSSDKIGEPLL